jgi:hypothetical protein
MFHWMESGERWVGMFVGVSNHVSDRVLLLGMVGYSLINMIKAHEI